MEADFRGYATKANVLCTDGKTIMPDAFKHQDQVRVPLVWQHGHTDPENVLGHAILENRPDGVYAYGFFNKSGKAKHAAGLLEHKDVDSLSIWANQLIMRGGRVVHGTIRELSLVLAGANPGALIEHVSIRHSDGSETALDDEAIIHSGESLDFSAPEESKDETGDDNDDDLGHAALNEDATIQDVYDSLDEMQKNVVHYLVGEALETAAANSDNSLEQSNLNQEGNTMTNVFEAKGGTPKHVMAHDAMEGVLTRAKQIGSLKDATQEYALSHGIENIEELFPDAKTVSDMPEWIKRRTEWVTAFLGATRKSPFARIKTINADITLEEARARGYIKGSLKKEEFFPVAKRVTTPTTVYKKQALDRDDMIDITDYNVVMWLKAEMRIMLDEEVARASLLGDGRDISSEDKINEQCIRPIASDHELYTTVVNVNVSDANSSMNEVLDAILMNRSKLKGSGSPDFYTTEYWIARFLLLRDNDNRRMYRSLAELALELRVANIIPVEAMLEQPDIIGIMVNPTDYVHGADKGGEVTMFDDFDIDYNKQKYLIETRLSGALTKIKSAMVVKSIGAANVLVSPAMPAFNSTTGALTITNQTGVVYKNGAGVVINAAGSPYTVAPGATYVVNATPASGYFFATSDDDSWSFTRPA